MLGDASQAASVTASSVLCVFAFAGKSYPSLSADDELPGDLVAMALEKTSATNGAGAIAVKADAFRETCPMKRTVACGRRDVGVHLRVAEAPL